jgi:predicted ArsR family transcriptional regulator
VLRETFGDVPSLSDILTRGLEEVRQLGATGAKFDEQIRIVRQAVEVHGCRTSAETVEETGLSRWAVERALEKLVADRILETRDGFRLADAAEEPGRPATEYHPIDTPRGEVSLTSCAALSRMASSENRPQHKSLALPYSLLIA